MSNDHSIWLDFLHGQQSAYAKLYELYARPMYLYALQFTSNEVLIEDAIHDVFVRLYTKRAKLPVIQNIKLYLFIALKNELLNRQNQHRNILFQTIENIELAGKENVEEELIERERHLHKKDLVLKFYSILSPRQKEAVRYHFEDELSYREISGLMHINAQSVKNIVQSAIKKIRSTFPFDR